MILELSTAFSYLSPRFFERLITQQAALTIHLLPSGKDAFVPFESTVSPQFLYKFIIPAATKWEMRCQLSDYGIHRAPEVKTRILTCLLEHRVCHAGADAIYLRLHPQDALIEFVDCCIRERFAGFGQYG